MPLVTAGYAFTIQFDPELKTAVSLGGWGFSPDVQAPAMVGLRVCAATRKSLWGTVSTVP
jgi:hypothetical protein